MSTDTWEATIEVVTPIRFVGSLEGCTRWSGNLMGCEIKVVGNDGCEYVIGIVTRTESTNMSARF